MGANHLLAGMILHGDGRCVDVEEVETIKIGWGTQKSQIQTGECLKLSGVADLQGYLVRENPLIISGNFMFAKYVNGIGSLESYIVPCWDLEAMTVWATRAIYKFLAWFHSSTELRSYKIIKYFNAYSIWMSWFSSCCSAIESSAKDCNHWRCGGWLWSLAETFLAVRCSVRWISHEFFQVENNMLDRFFGQWLTN